MRGDGLSYGGEVNEHEIAKLRLRELCDPYDNLVTLNTYPLVVFRVFTLVWKFHG
jgi:hypothetical protein